MSDRRSLELRRATVTVNVLAAYVIDAVNDNGGRIRLDLSGGL
jgi:hypothetical protein